MNSLRFALPALALSALCASGPVRAEGLRLRSVEGSSLVVSAGEVSNRPISVAAEDGTGRPLAGVLVRFRLPREAPTGRFASGLLSESFLTSDDGRATVFGINWHKQTGELKLKVSASYGTQRAELEIPIELSPHLRPKEALVQPAAGRFPARASNRNLRLLVAAGGGAAIIAVVTLFKRPSTPSAPTVAAPLALPPVPPTIGVPSIVITPPGK